MGEFRVLVVEDERIVALDLVQRLRAHGYAVDGFATRADEALARARAERPDLVLMDIHLEGEADGIEAAQALHAETRIPVVFLTAYADDDTLQRAQATLPYGYLLKPCQDSELKATIRMALARHAAEMRLERSEERQRLALRAARLGVWEWRADSDAIDSGGFFADILGAKPDAPVATWGDFLNRVYPEDREALRAAIAAAQAAGGMFDTTFRIQRNGVGGVAWVEFHAHAFAATAHRPARVIGTLKDITERHQTEQLLQQAAAVYEATADGICMMDAQFGIVSVNPAFILLTGFDADEAIGQPLETLLDARVLDRMPNGSLEARPFAADSDSWQGEMVFRRKEGDTFPAWLSLAQVSTAPNGTLHHVAVFSDITALAKAETELQRLAHFDPLTGLSNRLLLNDRLAQALERARRNPTRLALLLLDLDNFKTINDTLGHGCGDQLLRTVAHRMEQQLRHSDTLARLGGDEFVVLLDTISHPEDAARVASKLLASLTKPVELDGSQPVNTSASIGISLYPDDGADAAALFKAADTAMYQAKAEGRNAYRYHTPEMALRSAERMTLEQGLRHALAHGELALHYQPQVALADGSLVGFEALARWQPPGKAPIPPDQFIPVAEASGLIEALGVWVLEEACRQGARWRQAGWQGRLAVNVSGRQLANPQFVGSVRAALVASGFAANRLELEITESSLLAFEGSRAMLDELKALGVQVAIDDFGTGYSSLAVLKHLPLDRLKIDRSFVDDLPGSADDAAIVEAICALARTLKLNLVAEGVETAGQQQALRRLGCDEAQGYGYSRPLPAGEIDVLLRADPPWRGVLAAA